MDLCEDLMVNSALPVCVCVYIDKHFFQPDKISYHSSTVALSTASSIALLSSSAFFPRRLRRFFVSVVDSAAAAMGAGDDALDTVDAAAGEGVDATIAGDAVIGDVVAEAAREEVSSCGCCLALFGLDSVTGGSRTSSSVILRFLDVRLGEDGSIGAASGELWGDTGLVE